MSEGSRVGSPNRQSHRSLSSSKHSSNRQKTPASTIGSSNTVVTTTTTTTTTVTSNSCSKHPDLTQQLDSPSRQSSKSRHQSPRGWLGGHRPQYSHGASPVVHDAKIDANQGSNATSPSKPYLKHRRYSQSSQGM